MNEDELKINIVVDYFDEKWNDRKSDVTKGERKYLFTNLV